MLVFAVLGVGWGGFSVSLDPLAVITWFGLMVWIWSFVGLGWIGFW